MAVSRLRPALVAAALACAASATQAGQPTVCHAGDAVAPAAATAAADGGNVDECILRPEAMRDAVWSGAAIVDARIVAGLRNPWIPGASTPTRAELAASAFGDARVVVVGNARDMHALLDLCRRLHAQGRHGVRVLAGGIEAWRRAGQPLRGDASVLDRPAFVGDIDLARVAATSPGLIVFDADADPALRPLGAENRVAGRRETRAGAARRIARALERARVVPGVEPVTVVVADRGASAEWLAAWNATPYPNPQFYAGRDADYRLALTRSERIAAERDQPLPGPCDR
ncbi:rhodanese-like domain-containing protein [Tahibacter soli]|uniref:Rhodanese domain-containing protein n=1 Tax=Tahibacter soli TaxID=2983605 RepID=A0A9X3YPG3_9GAMM|nr:hypothetical protein [Tahibacter soli]MDC8015055.1 hypothetical protein [Tahibacter soli]